MYTVAIRKNDTGEVRQHQEKRDWDDGNHFLWRRHEGNYGCDCNRELFWLRAGGVEDPDSCCSVDRFDIMQIELPDGTKMDGSEFN